ncbi:MAG: hypothetical protein MRT15_11715 [archaeon YNP-LCB-003-016]|uniref:hypothetical protein n=1 Tax=Candidatus Culexarchaeum yellowstonense TaxID=2928963 RepID=UPI0026EF27D1|nr:hypothetical protein [Candidatus Culexarchaeum yellowstonense]MCR6693052.1 hypothetical protein [Candidatus Culexarchaeum yellowstonense]
MEFTDIPCHRCGGRMHPNIRKIEANGYMIIEVVWKCDRCGSMKGAIIGGG